MERPNAATAPAQAAPVDERAVRAPHWNLLVGTAGPHTAHHSPQRPQAQQERSERQGAAADEERRRNGMRARPAAAPDATMRAREEPPVNINPNHTNHNNAANSNNNNMRFTSEGQEENDEEDADDDDDEDAAGGHSEEAAASTASDSDGQGEDEPQQQEEHEVAVADAAISPPSTALSSSLPLPLPLRSRSARACNLLPVSWRTSFEAQMETPASSRSRRPAAANKSAAAHTIRKAARGGKQQKALESEGASSAAAAGAAAAGSSKSPPPSVSGVLKKKSGRFLCPFHCSAKAEFAFVSRRTIKRHVIECTYRDAKCGKILNAQRFDTEQAQYEAVKKLLIEEKKFSAAQLKGFVFREHKEKRDKWDTPYNSRWYCPNQDRGCAEFYVSTSSTSKAAHLRCCEYGLAPVVYTPQALKELRERLRKEADARAEQATRRLAAEAQAAEGDKTGAAAAAASSSSCKAAAGSVSKKKNGGKTATAAAAANVLNSSVSPAFKKSAAAGSATEAAAAAASAAPAAVSAQGSRPKFSAVQTKDSQLSAATHVAAAAASAKKRVRGSHASASAAGAAAMEVEGGPAGSEVEEAGPASSSSSSTKNQPKRARKQSHPATARTTASITQSAVALAAATAAAAAAATVSSPIVVPADLNLSITPAMLQAYHTQAVTTNQQASVSQQQRPASFYPGGEYLGPTSASAPTVQPIADFSAHFRLEEQQPGSSAASLSSSSPRVLGLGLGAEALAAAQQQERAHAMLTARAMQLQAQLVASSQVQSGGTVASHSPYAASCRTLAPAFLQAQMMPQAIAARPLLSQAAAVPPLGHGHGVDAITSPMIDARLQQQYTFLSMYAAAQAAQAQAQAQAQAAAAAAARSPASTTTVALTPNPHRAFHPQTASPAVVSAGSLSPYTGASGPIAAAAQFRLPCSVFDASVSPPADGSRSLQIDMLSYKLGMEHAAREAESKREARRAAKEKREGAAALAGATDGVAKVGGSKRKNRSIDAVAVSAPTSAPLVAASADAEKTAALKRVKLPAAATFLSADQQAAAAGARGGFQPQLMSALSVQVPQQQQQQQQPSLLHQHFSQQHHDQLQSSQAHRSMSRESTAATAPLDQTGSSSSSSSYGVGNLSLNAASLLHHVAQVPHFSSSHSSPMPRLTAHQAHEQLAARSGEATQQATSGASTSSSFVYASHQSMEGQGVPMYPSPEQYNRRLAADGHQIHGHGHGWASSSAPNTSPHLDRQQQHELVFSPQIVPKQPQPQSQLEGVVEHEHEGEGTSSPVVETMALPSLPLPADLSFESSSKLDLLGAVDDGTIIEAHSGDTVMRTPRLHQRVPDGDLRGLFSPGGELPAAVLSSAVAPTTPRRACSPSPTATGNPPVISRSLCMLGGAGGKPSGSSRPNSSLGDMVQRIAQQQQLQQQAQQAPPQQQQQQQFKAHSPMHAQASVQLPPPDLLARLEAQKADLMRQLETQQRFLRAQSQSQAEGALPHPSASASAPPSSSSAPEELLQLELQAKELARQRNYLIQLQRQQNDQNEAMRQANLPAMQMLATPPPQLNAQSLEQIMQQVQMGQLRQQQAHLQWMQQAQMEQQRAAAAAAAMQPVAPLSVLQSPLLIAGPPPMPAPLPTDPSRRRLLQRMSALSTEQLQALFMSHQRAT